MKIFGLEIRRAENQPAISKASGSFFGAWWETPQTSIEMYYKYFRKNSDIRRCIQEIQNNVSQEWYYFSKNESEVEKPELNAIMEYGKWFRNLKASILRDVMIGGNAYIVKLRNASNKMIGLATIDPRTIRVHADQYWEILKYDQFVNGKVIHTYMPEDIVRCYDELDPDNEIFGLSYMEGIILDILADNESALMNYHYFKNSAMPSIILKAGANTSNEELQNTVETMRKNFSGGSNKHKIGILRGIEWVENIQDSMSDMQFEVMRWFNTNRICATFGVPKVILGYTDGVNYTNADIQYGKFIENTIGPWEFRLQNWLRQALSEFTDVELNLYKTKYDITKAKIEIMILKLTNGLLSVNEAREELWYEQFDLEEANIPLIGKTLDRLEDVWLSDIPVEWS